MTLLQTRLRRKSKQCTRRKCIVTSSQSQEKEGFDLVTELPDFRLCLHHKPEANKMHFFAVKVGEMSYNLLTTDIDVITAFNIICIREGAEEKA